MIIKTALVAMTIVGCDCDARLCEYIGETPAQWSSLADCEAAMKTQVLHSRNYDYPLISGVCRTVQPPRTKLAAVPEAASEAPQMAALPPELDHRPSVPVGARTTAAEADAARPLAFEEAVDDGNSMLYRTKGGYAVLKTGLGRAADGTADMAKRSMRWLSSRMPGWL